MSLEIYLGKSKYLFFSEIGMHYLHLTHHFHHAVNQQWHLYLLCQPNYQNVEQVPTYLVVVQTQQQRCFGLYTHFGLPIEGCNDTICPEMVFRGEDT